MNISVYFNKAASIFRRFTCTLVNKIRFVLNGVKYGNGLNTNGLVYVRNGLGGYLYRSKCHNQLLQKN